MFRFELDYKYHVNIESHLSNNNGTIIMIFMRQHDYIVIYHLAYL